MSDWSLWSFISSSSSSVPGMVHQSFRNTHRKFHRMSVVSSWQYSDRVLLVLQSLFGPSVRQALSSCYYHWHLMLHAPHYATVLLESLYAEQLPLSTHYKIDGYQRVCLLYPQSNMVWNIGVFIAEDMTIASRSSCHLPRLAMQPIVRSITRAVEQKNRTTR